MFHQCVVVKGITIFFISTGCYRNLVKLPNRQPITNYNSLSLPGLSFSVCAESCLLADEYTPMSYCAAFMFENSSMLCTLFGLSHTEFQVSSGIDYFFDN